MADLTEWLSQEAGVPVIDGVTAATRMVEALVGCGLKTSKIGAYARPIKHNFFYNKESKTCRIKIPHQKRSGQ